VKETTKAKGRRIKNPSFGRHKPRRKQKTEQIEEQKNPTKVGRTSKKRTEGPSKLTKDLSHSINDWDECESVKGNSAQKTTEKRKKSGQGLKKGWTQKGGSGDAGAKR